MKINNKGFTLVEVLVSVVILGIIVGLAYPAVSNMQARNNNKKFTYYADSLKEAAKVYVKTNEKDFQIPDNTEKENYCFNLQYSELLAKGLIKPYTDSNIDCSNGTYIQIVKKNGQDYDYEANLVCKSSGKEVYKNEITNTCNASDFAAPTVNVTLDLKSDKTAIIATIEISDPSKINLKENHNTISYAWSDYENEYADDLVYESYTLTNADKDTSGNIVFTKELQIPPSENTKYFIINATGIEDGAGNTIKSGNSITKVTKTYDTLAPTISTLSIDTQDTRFKTRNVDLSITVSKTESSLKYRTSLTNSFSGDWKSATGSGTNWKVGSADLGDDYTGATKTVYVQVQDVNGNVSDTKSNTYTTYKYCDTTGNWNIPNFSECTKTCGTGTQSRTKTLYDLYFGNHLCSSVPESQDCNKQSCAPPPSISMSAWQSGWNGNGYQACTGNWQNNKYNYSISTVSSSLSSGYICYSGHCGYYSTNTSTGYGYACFSGKSWAFYRSSGNTYGHACNSAGQCTDASC